MILPCRETGFSGTDDRSWLPGRVCSWIGPNNYSNTAKTDDRTAKFYEAAITKSIWEVPVGQNYPIPLQQHFGLATEGPIQLMVRLMRTDDNGGELLAQFDDFAIDCLAEMSGKNKSDSSGYKFGYRFHIIESGNVLAEDAWLKSQWSRRSDPSHRTAQRAVIRTLHCFLLESSHNDLVDPPLRDNARIFAPISPDKQETKVISQTDP